MAYNKEKFEKLRSLEVPRKIALALADDESPLNVSGGDSAVTPVVASISQLSPGDLEDLNAEGLDLEGLIYITNEIATRLNDLIEIVHDSGLVDAFGPGSD